MAIILDGTNGETFPSWTTAGRPATPAAGQMGYNSTLSQMEYYSGGSWISCAATTSASLLTSGTLPTARLPTGTVLQVVSTAKTDTFSTTSTSFVNVTGLSVTITPSSATSKILVIAGVSLGAEAGIYAAFPRMTRNGTAIFVSDAAGVRVQGSAMYELGVAVTIPIALNYLDSPATTSATTYQIQLASNSASYSARVNASAGDSNVSNWSRGVSSITVMEIAA